MKNQFILSILLLAFLPVSSATGQYSVSLSKGSVTVSLEEYKSAFRNPMKGFREFFSPGVDKKRAEYPYPYGTLVKEYMQWNMLENSASDGVDRLVDYSNHRWAGVEDINMKVIPRVFLVWVEPWHGGTAKDPGNPDDLNGSHWPSDMLPEYDSPYKQIPGSVGAMVGPEDLSTQIKGGYFAPDFPDRVRNLVRKMGEAWDNDPRVAYVEMGIIGEWGEHHDPDISTFWPPHDEPVHVAGRTWLPGIEKVLGDAFTDAFKNKKVMVRYAYEFRDYQFGIYWDSWSIDQEIDRGYNEMLRLKDRWKSQPIGGEITWNWGSLGLKGYKSFEDCVKDDSTRQLVIEQIRNLHCNHLGGITWADFNDPQFVPYADLLQRSLGYRYVMSSFVYPKRVENGESFNISFRLTNQGSSPFYYNWPVEISLLDIRTHEKVWGKILDKVKISDWMPGETWSVTENRYLEGPPVYTIGESLEIGANVKPGQYIIAVSILDPAGMVPSLRFANTNYFEGGVHPVGFIGVGRRLKNFALDPSAFYDIQSDKSLKYSIKD